MNDQDKRQMVGLLRKALQPLLHETLVEADVQKFSEALLEKMDAYTKAIQDNKPEAIDLSPITNTLNTLTTMAKRSPDKIEIPELEHLTERLDGVIQLFEKSAKPTTSDEPPMMRIANLDELGKFMKELNPATTTVVNGGSKYPFLNTKGQNVAMQLVDDGSGNMILPVQATVSASITPTASGVDNWVRVPFPTKQTVIVESMPGVSVAPTTSGSPSHVFIDGFPTTITTNVQSMPAVSVAPTTSGSPSYVSVINTPTIQTVREINPGTRNWTLTSGVDSQAVSNFPTIQTVREANPGTRSWTLTSGTDNVGVVNFPTVQTVQLTGFPNITASGVQHTVVDNYPTIMSVNIQPSVNAIGTVGTTSASINVGQKILATTATQLSAVSTVPTNGIIVQALSINSASVFIGGSSVTVSGTNGGFELQPGQAVSFTCNLNTMYGVGYNNTDKVCWTVV